jgi:hypothetical protein
LEVEDEMQQCDFESEQSSIINESEGIIVPTANPDFKNKKKSVGDIGSPRSGGVSNLLKHLPVSP